MGRRLVGQCPQQVEAALGQVACRPRLLAALGQVAGQVVGVPEQPQARGLEARGLEVISKCLDLLLSVFRLRLEILHMILV
mmetsp:Transcript_15757/g.27992  ORF Transcript_15757/g.27992 Transcript_15757/m.27992 type:complete len:81 (+) Transcript_15757:281-523(+)